MSKFKNKQSLWEEDRDRKEAENQWDEVYNYFIQASHPINEELDGTKFISSSP